MIEKTAILIQTDKTNENLYDKTFYVTSFVCRQYKNCLEIICEEKKNISQNIAKYASFF